ncbi:MAG: sensor histidine kinase [Candidatus Thorarchaeota archaeon]
MISSRKILGQVGIRALLTVVSAVALTIVGSKAWESSDTIMVFDSLLAFLAITSAAYVYGTYRRDPSTQNAIFFAALVTQGVIYIGSSVDYLLGLTSPTVLKTPDRITSDIIEVSLLAIMFLSAIILRNKKISPRASIALILLIVFGSLSFYGIFYAFVLAPLSELEFFLIIIGFIGTSIAIVAFFIAGMYVIKYQKESQKYDLVLLLLSLTVFSLASIPLFLNLISPAAIWTLSLALQTGGFFALTLSVAVPWQMELGVSRWKADASIATLLFLAFTPFIVFVLVESWAPEASFIYLGAYYLSHGEAAILSGLIAFLVYAYSRRNPSPEYYPLILLFLSWAYMELHLVLFSPSDVLIAGNEPILPYVIGSILSIVLLFWATNSIKETPAHQSESYSVRKTLLWICLVISLVWIGELIRDQVIQLNPEVTITPIAPSFILVANLLAMFAFIYLEYLLTTKGGGIESAGVVTAGFLALWIVRNILKAVFEVWSIGWWAAEILLLVGLVVGLGILGMLYLSSMFEAESSQRKATVYADLLGHDITNYLQAIQVALGILNLDEAAPEAKSKALEEARLSLTRADHLIRNVRYLGQPSSIHARNIERMDLMSSIQVALNQVIQISAPDEIEFNIRVDDAERYVYANDLLTDVFMNLFRNAVKYSNQKKRIDIEIESTTIDDQKMYQIRVTDYGRGIEPERKESLFSRFMEGADGTGLGLWVVQVLTESFGGMVEVMDRVEGSYSQGAVFVVTLPVYVDDDIAIK